MTEIKQQDKEKGLSASIRMSSPLNLASLYLLITSYSYVNAHLSLTLVLLLIIGSGEMFFIKLLLFASQQRMNSLYAIKPKALAAKQNGAR